MILILLNYKVDLAEVDTHLNAHVEWLKQGVADDRLLVAGRKTPRTGGVIIARGTMDEVRQWAATDPFALAGVADYDFIEVTPSIVAPGLDLLKT